MTGRVRVFCACSLDGFIAGEHDDLSFLPPPATDGSDDGYGAFMKSVGAILMGRKTYDVASGFEGPWSYGDTPVLVATTRPLAPRAPTVTALAGPIEVLVEHARKTAREKDVYLDGGTLIRAALDTHLIDDMTVTLIPVILGAGHPLFAGAKTRHALTLASITPLRADMLQLRYRPGSPA